MSANHHTIEFFLYSQGLTGLTGSGTHLYKEAFLFQWSFVFIWYLMHEKAKKTGKQLPVWLTPQVSNFLSDFQFDFLWLPSALDHSATNTSGVEFITGGINTQWSLKQKCFFVQMCPRSCQACQALWIKEKLECKLLLIIWAFLLRPIILGAKKLRSNLLYKSKCKVRLLQEICVSDTPQEKVNFIFFYILNEIGQHLELFYLHL